MMLILPDETNASKHYFFMPLPSYIRSAPRAFDAAMPARQNAAAALPPARLPPGRARPRPLASMRTGARLGGEGRAT